MKAVLCKEYGLPEDLVIEEVESPRAGRGEVVIKVKACGVSFPDTLIIQGKYQFKPPMPFSPGGELAGIVQEVGPGVEHIKPGDHVIAFTGWGGYAQEVVTEASRIIAMPPNMDFATAAIFIMTYGTSHYALKDRAHLKAGETLLVLGAAGGVGLAAVELGKVMGARVIAAASSDEKLAVCKRYGADEVINYSTEDLKDRIKELTGGNGVDVIYDPVGGKYAEPALRGMAWEGRYLVVGFADGEIPRIPLNLTLLKGCAIVGVFWGSFTARDPERNQQHLQELLSWYSSDKIKPFISATYTLEEAPQALRAMMERKVKGKVALLIE
ncbi:MAG TPA: NADPH:quinone oxidoreductase family protein [Ktedonosporobacter sp.]|jgi:NADPH2:quinone reductase|nr:NADPH:quinone oxidoreductase family protein [Ktedonosporobacter sp.]